MKSIKRESILNAVRPFYHDEELVKILVGMRRVGKSVILNQIREEISDQGVGEDKIISIDFEMLQFSDYLTPKSFHKYVDSLIKDDSLHYLFVDEIQELSDFEKVLTSLRVAHNISIFVTGSNGKLLSDEISTILTGRYVKFEVPPLSFTDALEIANVEESKIVDFFKNSYMQWGSLPHRFSYDDDRSLRSYLFDVFESISKRDVVQRAKITNINLYEDLLKYMLENSGNLFSAEKLYNYLKNKGRNVSKDTIYDYAKAIETAILMRKVHRYNIADKSIMDFSGKYYATDIGIFQIKADPTKINRGATLETIVYNELRRQGFEVFVGKLPDGEVDFVTHKNGQLQFIQVCYLLNSEEVIEREFKSLQTIRDNHPKLVLSLDEDNFSRDGIIHQNVVSWIIEQNKKGDKSHL